MKGLQKLTLCNEALREAIEEYLQRRSRERIEVSEVWHSYDDTESAPGLLVGFSSKAEQPRGEGQ
jgi:hypothetical protein